MKRAVIAIILLAFCLFAGIFETVEIKKAYAYSNDKIEKAMEYIVNDNAQECISTCKELSEYWHKRYTLLTAMADHKCLDNIITSADALSNMSEIENKDDIIETLIAAKNNVYQYKNSHQFSFGNIF